MFSEHRRKLRILFAVSDAILVSLAFWAAYQTRTHLALERLFFLEPRIQLLLLGSSVILWITIGYKAAIYDHLETAPPSLILRDTLRQCFWGIVGLVVLEFILHPEVRVSRPFLGLYALYCWILLCLFRFYADPLLRSFRREFGARHFVMVAGVGEAARRMGRELEEAEHYGVRLIGFLTDEPGPAPETVDLSSSYPVHPLSELPNLLGKHVIDEVIFAVDSRRLAELEEIFLLCDEEGVRTRVAVDFFPHVNSDLYLERLGKLPLLTFSATPHDEIQLLVKRSLDVCLSAAALLLVLPLMALIALLIRLTSPGPAIFCQIRCGLNGRRFVFYKFRSMCQNAEQMKASVQHLTERDLAIKIPNDPRLTVVGRYLRKFSVDEWPQLWNVLKGDMSLVGPRPAIPEEVEQYKRWQRRRLRMRPGLTCLWAVSGRDAIDFETWMKMDMQYIDNWSLALDWKILLLTIPSVLTGKGAH